VDLKIFGNRGEDVAAKFLKRSGYKILARNYRTKGGEIDIVARDGGTLVFVEVKSRRSERFGAPVEAVDARKQSRIIKAAYAYLAAETDADCACRFDIVGVFSDKTGETCELIRDAFELSGGY
jgi:putative endonuclease